MSGMLRGSLVAVGVWLLFSAAGARAYVDLAPTLATVLRDSQSIAVAEVDRFSPEKGAVILKRVRMLKGELADEPIKHQLSRNNQPAVDRGILEWAEPGRRCVVFVSGNTALVCMGEGWYQVQSSSDGWWRLGAARPDLPLGYWGTVSRLSDAIAMMLAGKTAVITTLPHGAGQEGASFDIALNRASLPGLVRVQRLRAHLQMSGPVMAVSANPAYLVGQGPVGEEDIPALREKLRADDATVRAESALELGTLGRAATVAERELAELLKDPSPRVRLAAAASLLRIRPRDESALEVLAKGLASDEAATRRQAARAAGLAGPAAAPLVGKLGQLLADSDRVVRALALQAIATLGPAAATAQEAVAALLDKHETVIDAADALGRMGPAARPIAKRIVPLLSSKQVEERWAGVRGLSQIGGPDAAPAVQFMIREMRTASEVDGYNMMIYLALLGPVAKDAIPAIRTARVKNPVLRQATTWAIEPAGELPWLGPMGNIEFARYIYGAYALELGDHIRPTVRLLARKIMDGSAGDVPVWGYKLLARFPDESLPILTPALSDDSIRQRERAAVALGYMGPAAAPAKPQLVLAIEKAPGEKEQRLLKWCLREIE